MEKFRPEDSTDELPAFDLEKHASPELKDVKITGFNPDPKTPGYIVDVQGVGSYCVEFPNEILENQELSPAQAALANLEAYKRTRVDVAHIIMKDPKAILVTKDDKKSA